MAIPREGELVTLGPWPRGANNFAREDSVPASSFRRGINVDVFPGGKVRRRKGLTQSNATPLSNLWSDGSYALATSIDGRSLLRVVPGQAYTTLATPFLLDSEVTYCSVNDYVYASDGTTAVRINTFDDSVRPWSVPTATAAPALTATNGALDPGTYQVCLTYERDDGVEGGATQASLIELTGAGGGIAVSLNPVLIPADCKAVVYVSRQNGKIRYRYGVLSAGGLLTINDRTRGRPLRTFGMQEMPAGHLSALVGGRFVVAVENMLVWSDSLNYGVTNLAKNFIPFVGRIDMIAPTVLGAAADGIYVAAGSRTYFLQGEDIAETSNRLARGEGAMPGVPEYIHGGEFERDGMPSQPLPTWLGKDGVVCVGLPTGQVIELTHGRYEMRVGDRAQIAHRELAGVNQIIANVRSPASASVGVAGDSADTVLIRNGVVID